MNTVLPSIDTTASQTYPPFSQSIDVPEFQLSPDTVSIMPLPSLGMGDGAAADMDKEERERQRKLSYNHRLQLTPYTDDWLSSSADEDLLMEFPLLSLASVAGFSLGPDRVALVLPYAPRTAPSTLSHTTPHTTISRNGLFSASLAISTQRQNLRLASVIAALNRMSDGKDESHLSDSLSLLTNSGSLGRSDEYAYMIRGPGGFEKNYAEIQKLLERARNPESEEAENVAQPTAPLPIDTDKSAKKKRPAGDLGVGPSICAVVDKLAMPLDANGQPLAGRKPIRVIKAELEKRIELLKTNQGEWEAFQTRIMKYKRDDHKSLLRGTQIDLIRKNKQLLKEMYPDFRQQALLMVRINNENHRVLVLERKIKIVHKKQRAKMEAIQRKEELIERGKLREKDELGKPQALQKKWFIIVALASRVRMIQKLLEQTHKRTAASQLQNHAARVIQRAYRKYKRAAAEERQRAALQTIQRVFHSYVQRRREVIKNNAANLIRTFFKEVYDTSKLMKVVKKYRFSVIRAQRYARSYITILRAELELCVMQWDHFEAQWWTQRKGSMHKTASVASIDEKAGKSKKRGKKGKKDDSADKGGNDKVSMLRCPDPIKIRLIRESLLQRRKEHRQQLGEYEDQLAKFNADRRKRLKPMFSRAPGKTNVPDPDMPKRPFFKASVLVLLSRDDLFALMEKGFVESTTSKLSSMPSE
ncbi:uncharacterized protein BJ171DRAFT_641684 [Polychytrium aggregatum]|uniref:uncharacterized protein n=1 Tax=Polychytrium aggregatum TaxID=110093 RepID=UPI0022FDBCDF|nr:uncharacterized protein BJ171DRAFT_641684 [Polychytrium aggregatum]KAI9206882.1 hypothetical protein BJ171DRAFT_641684 [Polychytrium aggregatum]